MKYSVNVCCQNQSYCQVKQMLPFLFVYHKNCYQIIFVFCFIFCLYECSCTVCIYVSFSTEKGSVFQNIFQLLITFCLSSFLPFPQLHYSVGKNREWRGCGVWRGVVSPCLTTFSLVVSLLSPSLTRDQLHLPFFGVCEMRKMST